MTENCPLIRTPSTGTIQAMAERSKAAMGRELKHLRETAPGGKLPQTAVAIVAKHVRGAPFESGTVSRAERGKAHRQTYDVLFEAMRLIHSGQVDAPTAALAADLRTSRETLTEDAFHAIVDIAIRNNAAPETLAALAVARRAAPDERAWTYWADQLAKAMGAQPGG